MARLAALVALFLVPTVTAAQSLGEAARREREKREARRPPARVYGDDDLRKAGEQGNEGSKPATSETGAGASSATPEASAGEAGASGPREKDESAARSAAEAAWRRRASPMRQAVEAAEARVRRLEARVEDLERDRLSVLPLVDVYADSALVEARRQLEESREELAAARKAWEDLQEQARRDGALPGWLR